MNRQGRQLLGAPGVQGGGAQDKPPPDNTDRGSKRARPLGSPANIICLGLQQTVKSPLLMLPQSVYVFGCVFPLFG